MENSKNIFNEEPKSSLTKALDVISTMASKPSGFIGLAILVFHIIFLRFCYNIKDNHSDTNEN